MTKEKNYGLVVKPPREQDWFMGDNKAPKDVINLSGDYTEFFPAREYQSKDGFDPLDCATHAALNVIEIIETIKWNKDVNYSDRYIAKLSGTTKRGNTVNAPLDAVREYGLVRESEYPFPKFPTWDKFYKDIAKDLIESGKIWTILYNLNHEWIDPRSDEKMKEAMRYSPLEVVVPAWHRNSDGLYYAPEDARYNHLTVCARYGDNTSTLWDTYDNLIKEWDNNSNFLYAKRLSVAKTKINIMLEKSENEIVFNSDTGACGIVENGKIRVANTPKEIQEIIVAYLVRQWGKTLNNEEWEKAPKESLH